MNFHSICTNAPVLRILNHVQLSKWTFSMNRVFLNNYKVLQRFQEPILRILCTDSSVQCYSYDIQNESEKDACSYYVQEHFLKENFKIVDARYFKLITFPNECNVLEKVLWTNEFKEVLSRSHFIYDVNVTESSKNYLCQVSSMHPDIHKSIFDTYENNFMNKESSSECDKVFYSETVNGNERTGPTEDQLLFIINKLTYSLINFFEKPHDYSIYHQDMVFQNNIKGVTIKGLKAYMQSMYFLKFYGYIHFVKVKVEILKMTHHVEDGSIRVRWRVNGLPRHRLISMLWKYKSINWKEIPKEETEWLDGFSIFYVGEDGLIYKHVCDKMIPDDNLALVKKVDLKTKVLSLLGLTPRGPAAGTLSTLIPCKSHELISCRKLT